MNPKSKHGKWPSRDIAKVNEVIKEWNATRSRGAPIHIVWGYANREDEAEERSQPKGYQQPEALLQYAGRDYTLRLSWSGDANFPDKLTLSSTFPEDGEDPSEEDFILPQSDPKSLYNILDALKIR